MNFVGLSANANFDISSMKKLDNCKKIIDYTFTGILKITI